MANGPYEWMSEEPTEGGWYLVFKDVGEVSLRHLVVTERGVMERIRIRRGRAWTEAYRILRGFLCFMGPIDDPPREMWEARLQNSKG